MCLGLDLHAPGITEQMSVLHYPLRIQQAEPLLTGSKRVSSKSAQELMARRVTAGKACAGKLTKARHACAFLPQQRAQSHTVEVRLVFCGWRVGAIHILCILYCM